MRMHVDAPSGELVGSAVGHELPPRKTALDAGATGGAALAATNRKRRVRGAASGAASLGFEAFISTRSSANVSRKSNLRACALAARAHEALVVGAGATRGASLGAVGGNGEEALITRRETVSDDLSHRQASGE
jgi:hypothetical protein